MKKIKTVFLIFSSIVLFSFALYIFLGPFFKISVVELNMDQKLKTSESYKLKEKKILSYLEGYKGQPLWQVNLKSLVEKVNTFYLGSEVYAVRKLPNRLLVFLKKKDTALLLLKEGKFFYSLSYEGEIGDRRSPEESFDFPILRGKLFWEKPQLRKRALFILSSIPKSGRFFSIQNISEISYNETNDSLLFYLIRGHFILELKDRASPKKIKNIVFVLNYLHQRGDKGGWIDARLDKKIVVKNLN